MHKYAIHIAWSVDDACFIATVPKFPGLSAFGDTHQKALEEALVAIDGFLDVFKDDGLPAPVPDTVKSAA